MGMMGNLLIKNAAELVTCSGFAAKRGAQMAELGVIPDGALAIEQGRIMRVGATGDVLSWLKASGKDLSRFDTIDASGKAVLPGFVDSHTHLVFGGYRAEEFAWRLRGDRYMEILQRGGGILSTVAATRSASRAELTETGLRRLDSMLSFGVTTVEGKSGYGLDRETEIKQLDVMADLNRRHPLDVVPTFMGAHAVPPSYKGGEEAYIDFLLEDWKDSSGKSQGDMVQDLANQGVKFDVCRNTLTGRNIKEDQVNMNAVIVPSGVATVAEMQLLGYVYVKP